MKLTLYILLIGLLTSCTKESALDFQDKWILINTTHNGKNKSIRNLNPTVITYELDGEIFEAIEFNTRDSTVTIPGLEKSSLHFSYSPKTHNLEFYQKNIRQNELDNSLIRVYLDKFEVLEPEQNGIIKLKSSNTQINVLPVKTLIEKSIEDFL